MVTVNSERYFAQIRNFLTSQLVHLPMNEDKHFQQNGEQGPMLEF